MSTNILDGYNYVKVTPGAFAGGTNGARGDKDAAGGTAFPLFFTTGTVKVIVWGECTKTLVGAGTLEVGITGNTALILPQVADATTIAANDTWVDATVAEVGGFVATALPAATYLWGGKTIQETAGTADITAGGLNYTCLWIPVSPDGNVVGAVAN